MNKKLIFPGLFFFLIIGCGYYEGVVQPTPVSYLSFFGNVEGAKASIDGGAALNLDRGSRPEESQKKVVLYRINPGKHTVIVTRMGKEVVNRVIIVGNGATQEIDVP